MTVMRSQKKKIISPISNNCKIPAMRCPRKMRVMPPKIQLVTGKIARMMLRIQEAPCSDNPYRF